MKLRSSLKNKSNNRNWIAFTIIDCFYNYRLPYNSWLLIYLLIYFDRLYEPPHEISYNVVCATSKASDQPAHMRSLIWAFASRLNILWMLSYWLNIIWRLHRLVWVNTYQKATLLEITCSCSYCKQYVFSSMVKRVLECLWKYKTDEIFKTNNIGWIKALQACGKSCC